MKSLTDNYTLHNGVAIPCVGFGTWQTPDGDVALNSVKTALEAGYRHIDTAAAYHNEGSVGQAVKQSGLSRDEVFITSKLANPMHGYDNTLKAFADTLDKLGTDYLDLYLIHWPNPIAYRDSWQKTNADTWKAFEELYASQKIRAIGISNFMPHHMEELLKTATIVPMVNQLRLCPGDIQDEVVAYCRKHGILPEAYSPLGTGKIFDVEIIQALAQKYQKTIAQVCLRWSLQMGFLPLPKSVTPDRIRENAQLFDFELTSDDVQLIASLDGVVGYGQDPDTTQF